MNNPADEFPRVHSRYKVSNEYQVIKYKKERFYFTVQNIFVDINVFILIISNK